MCGIKKKTDSGRWSYRGKGKKMVRGKQKYFICFPVSENKVDCGSQHYFLWVLGELWFCRFTFICNWIYEAVKTCLNSMCDSWEPITQNVYCLLLKQCISTFQKKLQTCITSSFYPSILSADLRAVHTRQQHHNYNDNVVRIAFRGTDNRSTDSRSESIWIYRAITWFGEHFPTQQCCSGEWKHILASLVTQSWIFIQLNIDVYNVY